MVGWQAIFAVLGLFAARCLLLVLRHLPETRPPELPPAVLLERLRSPAGLACFPAGNKKPAEAGFLSEQKLTPGRGP